MQRVNVFGLVLVTAAAAATPIAVSASGDRPTPIFVQCREGYTDIGNGQGFPMCVQPDNQFCPGTWTDIDGDGNIMWDYGECYYTGGEMYPAPPGGGPAPTDPPPTAPPPTDPPATPAPTDPPSAPQPTPAPTNAPDTPAPTSPPTTEPLPLSDPTVTITSAVVACDGMIEVSYDTAANPAPAANVSHLVVFNPTSNPADFHVAEFPDRDPYGTYTFEQLGSVADSYRVLVTVMFDPANPDAVALSDWAMASVVEGC